MEINEIITFTTMIITILAGIVAKKLPWFNNKLIPIQNILIGLVVALIEWIYTKDFSIAIAISGVGAGGTYDIIHNIQELINYDN